MSAVIVLLVVGAWFWLGFSIWKWLFAKRIAPGPLRTSVGVALAALWMLAPWIDEIAGARQFAKLCEEMPEVKFYGPVAVGPGPFFNEDGSPKWTTDAELGKLMQPEWSSLFRGLEELEEIRSLPFPIFERRTIRYFVRTGSTTEVLTERLSPGGWIKRATGWGSHAPINARGKATRGATTLNSSHSINKFPSKGGLK